MSKVLIVNQILEAAELMTSKRIEFPLDAVVSMVPKWRSLCLEPAGLTLGDYLKFGRTKAEFNEAS
jgi:hypothetical protein